MKSFFTLVFALLFQIQLAHADVAGMKAKIEKMFPREKIIEITKTPYFGLYEIAFSDSIVYTDESMRYFFSGNIFDGKTMKNLTEERARKLYAVKFDSLPLQYALKEVKGNGSRKLAVFTDPNCPYCKRLEKEIEKLKDVTVYRFVLAILPGSPEKAKNIWCAPDRNRAWHAALVDGITPPKSRPCDMKGLDETAKAAEKLGINGTPALIFADGEMNPGYMPADELEKMLSETSR